MYAVADRGVTPGARPPQFWGKKSKKKENPAGQATRKQMTGNY